jgi:hypothetical protein
MITSKEGLLLKDCCYFIERLVAIETTMDYGLPSVVPAVRFLVYEI